jgi:hypothetical protein
MNAVDPSSLLTRRGLKDRRAPSHGSDRRAAAVSIRPIALGRKNHLFAGSDGGGEQWAVAYVPAAEKAAA